MGERVGVARRLRRRIALLILIAALLTVPTAGGPLSQQRTLAPAAVMSSFERGCGYVEFRARG